MLQMLVYLLLGLALTWVAYMAYVWVASQSIRGKDIHHLLDKLPSAHAQEQLLLYCYSPSCGPCRGMNPIIDAMQKHGAPIVKLDMNQDPQLGRELEVRAVPTLLLVRHGVVEQSIIGSQSRQQIEALLRS